MPKLELRVFYPGSFNSFMNDILNFRYIFVLIRDSKVIIKSSFSGIALLYNEEKSKIVVDCHYSRESLIDGKCLSLSKNVMAKLSLMNDVQKIEYLYKLAESQT